MKPTTLPKLMILLLPVLIIASQCQASNTSPLSPTVLAATPTPALVAPIQPGDGTDVLDRLLETGVLRVGIRVWPEANYSPPAFRGASNAITGGAINGFEVEVAYLVANGLGLELELVEASPVVIASGAWQNQWDIALSSLVPFDQAGAGILAQNLVYSQPYGYIPLGILIADTQEDIESLDQLAGRTVGVLEHSVAQRLLTPTKAKLTIYNQPGLPNQPKVKLVVFSNLPKAIRQLGQLETEGEALPEFDAILGSTSIFAEAIKSDVPVKLAPEASQVGLQPLVIATVPQDDLKVDRLRAEVNNILSRAQKQGALAEIYHRWYEEDFSQPR